jgi:hypothetical protein
MRLEELEGGTRVALKSGDAVGLRDSEEVVHWGSGRERDQSEE